MIKDTSLQDIKDLDKRVSNLQNDMNHIDSLIDRLDTTIEKLTEVSTTVSQLLAVQGSRLVMQEKVAESLQSKMDKHKEDTERNNKEIYNKIDTVEREVHNEIQSTNKAVINEIKSLRGDIKEQSTDWKKQNVDISSRIDKLERWSWLIFGGAMVIFTLLDKVSWSSLF